EKQTIANKFFRLRSEPSASGSHVQFDYTFEALCDRVEPKEFREYEKAVNDAKDSIGYTLRYRTPAQLEKNREPVTFNWAVAAAGLCFLVSSTFFAVHYFRQSKLAAPRPPPIHGRARLDGIGGWLILIAIGLFLRSIGYLKAGFTLLPTMLKTDTWRSLTDPVESGYNAWWAPSLLFELFVNVGGLVFCILLIVLFLNKRAAWARCFALFLIASLLGVALDSFFAAHIPAAVESRAAAIRDIGSAAVAVVIWIPYVRLSKRVAQTFRY
ncbi:MAG TPA: DUF2569 domain-containing protein, partial [Chthoniobacterales bacterium]|nr:DUF2569 domain-containing protein [Chthoniobacterales bacterium]